ncbi:hypothetical protein K0H81_02480 [Shewanella halotolerans]|nr:hypothetical protein [Shewanella halotolerans]QYJ92057.1 hypothetical protein K0H81_02480 [Shewanella halotolerans]
MKKRYTEEQIIKAIKQHEAGAKVDDIRQATNKSMAIGNEKFKSKIERITGKSMRPQKMGRPSKNSE